MTKYEIISNIILLIKDQIKQAVIIDGSPKIKETQKFSHSLIIYPLIEIILIPNFLATRLADRNAFP